MPDPLLLIPLAASAAAAAIATPRMIALARTRGLTAEPDEERKIHEKPVPYLGGIAVLIGLLAGMLLATIFTKYPGEAPGALQTFGFAVGAVLIAIFGYIDDKRGLSPKTKLLAQIVVAVIVLACGTRIEVIRNPFNGLIELGWLTWPLTVFWIVGIINAVNLIDGLDGLASGIALIAACSFAAIGLAKGQFADVVLAVCLVGACAGFLPYNFYPARIFLGDAGSMLLGLALAVLSINGGFKSTTALTVVVPMLILAVPISDTSWAILRRAMQGKPIYSADKGHIHHRLMDVGLSHRKTVILLLAVSLILAVGAFLLGAGSAG